MENPFLKIDARLENLETLLLDIKHKTIPELINANDKSKQQVVDLDGLLIARPFIGSRSTIYKKVSSGEMPHSKNGKRLIFDLHEIDDWLLSNKIKTTKEIQESARSYIKGKGK